MRKTPQNSWLQRMVQGVLMAQSGGAEIQRSYQPPGVQPSYPIRSVDNALRILIEISERGALTVTASAQLIGVAPSTAHRLLGMLAYHGLVEEVGHRQGYRTGPTLLRIGLQSLQRVDVRGLARPRLERLSREVQETVNLITLEGPYVRFVDSVQGPQALRVASRVGLRRPAAQNSVGKALLAQLSDGELNLLQTSLRPEEDEDGIHDGSWDEMLKQLDEIRKLGYATNFGASSPEIRAIGVALRGNWSKLSIGVAVSAPATRLANKEVPRVVAALFRAAADIETVPLSSIAPESYAD